MDVTLHTNKGDIAITLFDDKAPETVGNFVGLAKGTKEWKDASTGETRTDPFYDGLTYTPAANNLCPSAGLLVALVIAPGLDFHWYRLNSDGYWAHKPGVDPATDLDDDGRRSLIRVLARAGLTRSSVVS